MMSRILLHFFVDDNQNEKQDTDICNSSISKSSKNTKSRIQKRISTPREEASQKEEIYEKRDQWIQEKRENTECENSIHAKNNRDAVPKWSDTGKKVEYKTFSKAFEFDAKLTPSESQIICLKAPKKRIEMFTRNFDFEKITKQNAIIVGNSHIYEIEEAKELERDRFFQERLPRNINFAIKYSSGQNGSDIK